MSDEDESIEVKLLREIRDEQRATNDYLARIAEAAERWIKREDLKTEALNRTMPRMPKPGL